MRGAAALGLGSSHGREVGSIGYTWWGSDARLILTYRCNGDPVSLTIELESSTPQFSGRRWWFVCPLTGARARALYLPPGAKLWGSRKAHKLAFQSQRESGQGKALARLLMRSGDWPRDKGLAAALMNDRDPFGFEEERRWERRMDASKRRNQVRAIARRQRQTSPGCW